MPKAAGQRQQAGSPSSPRGSREARDRLQQSPQGRDPSHDRWPARWRPRVAGTTDARARQGGRQVDRRPLAVSDRQARRVRHRGQLHRWGRRGVRVRREVRPRAGRADADRHPVLVLRQRDDGHGPVTAQGGVGLQRHRASGRRLPRGGAGRAHAEGAARVRDLRARRHGRGRSDDPGGRRGEDPPLRACRSRRRDDARAGVPGHGRRLDGHRRVHRRPAVLRALPRHARRDDRHDRVPAPHRSRHLRPARIQEGAGVGEGQLPRRQGLQLAGEDAFARAPRWRVGHLGQDGA